MLGEDAWALAKKDWGKAHDDLVTLRVGGRNLAKFSDLSKWGYKWNRSGTGTIGAIEEDPFFGSIHKTSRQFNINNASLIAGTVKKGGKITISFSAKGSVNFSPSVRLIDGSVERPISNSTAFAVGTEWKRFELSMNALNDFDGTQGIYVYGSGIDARILYITNIKVEKDSATPWTPAPEDINAHPFVVGLAESAYESRGVVEKANKKQEDWKSLTMMHGWTGSAEVAINDVGYVTVKGDVTSPDTVTNQAAPFILPTGYRPRHYLPVSYVRGSNAKSVNGGYVNYINGYLYPGVDSELVGNMSYRFQFSFYAGGD